MLLDRVHRVRCVEGAWRSLPEYIHSVVPCRAATPGAPRPSPSAPRSGSRGHASGRPAPTRDTHPAQRVSLNFLQWSWHSFPTRVFPLVGGFPACLRALSGGGIWNLVRGAPSFRGADCPGGVLVRAGPRPAVAKAKRGQKRRREKKAYSTRYSQAVSHPSTNQARPCLASEIRRDRARSGWYGPIV